MDTHISLHCESERTAKRALHALTHLYQSCVQDALVQDPHTDAWVAGSTLCSDHTQRQLLRQIDAHFDQQSIEYQCVFIRTLSERHTAKKLVVFDMDATLVEAETLDELATAIGVGEMVSAITAQAMQGEINFIDSFARRVALLQGIPVTKAAAVRDAIRLQVGAQALCAKLRKQGVTLALISGGFHYFADPIATQLGIEHVYANQLAEQNGLLTGEVVPPVVNATAKCHHIKSLMQKYNLAPAEVCAVGDGANDLPMLEMAGFGVALCGKPMLRQHIANQINTPNLAHLIRHLCAAV